ncbi:hypothetical protein M011DRAFT_92691 [Sporormia fimetaria CBS 119925]|uniref:Pyoverdine/dityrosine biosynthesis protein n=1 Tax=Sporormia fimetaria CBS 119925 TaxID=1340428 RepID=A0A6A6V8W2_9PLEO|nr:hypothetical protein M011DRAFT_92691 [Sporormia fimetaria CBS 119925]
MNVGISVFHAIQGIYCRGPNEELLAIEGRNADQVVTHWPHIRAHIEASKTSCTTLPSGVEVFVTPIELPGFQCHSDFLGLDDHRYSVRELHHEGKGCYLGLLTTQNTEGTSEEAEFRDWLETFFLLETSLWPGFHDENLKNAKAVRISEQITTLFETSLQNISSNDEWHIGRHGFLRRVLGFVARNERIQMAIPAFPCKSPNDRKVGGRDPDMAEHIALHTIHSFALKVKKMYPPAVTMWVISDGHVFSDCIGVDDATVSEYDKKLIDIYQRHYTSPEDKYLVRFRGLTDMFLSNSDIATTIPTSFIESIDLAHPIQTAHTPEVETARKIMMAGCQPSSTHFRSLLTAEHPATLSLYRGQTRFMQADLSTPYFLSKSLKQRKKLASIVAAEMIARNAAYSNLLELLFPNYVRLSIHAHSNHGPKYGICLFPREKIRAIDDVGKRHEAVPAYEFQVPTPWHNAVIKVEGDDMVYIGKAEIVKSAIESGEFEGGWVDGTDSTGGHFVLRRTKSTAEETPSLEEVSSKLMTQEKPSHLSDRIRRWITQAMRLGCLRSDHSFPEIDVIGKDHVKTTATEVDSSSDGSLQEKNSHAKAKVGLKLCGTS